MMFLAGGLMSAIAGELPMILRIGGHCNVCMCVCV